MRSYNVKVNDDFVCWIQFNLTNAHCVLSSYFAICLCVRCVLHYIWVNIILAVMDNRDIYIMYVETLINVHVLKCNLI